MATRNATVTETKFFLDHFGNAIQWSGLLNGDQGDNWEIPGALERSIQVTGTFGAGGTIVLEGSNDGTNFVTLLDPQGVAVSFTAAGLKSQGNFARYVRPRVTAGDGTTTLVATLVVRRWKR